MKTLLISILSFVFMTGIAFAEVQWNKDEGVITWDAVTKLENGLDIPATDDPPLYRVVRKPRSNGTITPMGETTQLTFPASIDAEGYFYVGVYCVRMFEGAPIVVEDEEVKSQTTWSNMEDTAFVPVPFGLASWLALEQVRNLKQIK